MGSGKNIKTHLVYDPTRHEKITDRAWQADVAQDAIQLIVRDFEKAISSSGSWPTHPLDDEGGSPKWALYSGAAGAVVSLRILKRAGYMAKDWSSVLRQIHSAYLLSPDYGYETGLHLGEIGILAPAYLADPHDHCIFERLVKCMKETAHHPAREITSGGAGMMHAALVLYEKTGERIWIDLYREAAHALWESWNENPETGEWLWSSKIFEGVRAYYGACHGIAGNVQALLRGIEFLPNEWAEAIVQRTILTLRLSSIRYEAGINWPLSAETDAVGAKRLVQWCHGAPGIVTALANLEAFEHEGSSEFESLLMNAGEFVWKAGPLAKGSGICHGTAGNGYAFLALYRRTGQALWLERARKFAVHAIRQSNEARKKYGRGRYTLWTGDGGLAVYLLHCIHPEIFALPGLHEF